MQKTITNNDLSNSEAKSLLAALLLFLCIPPYFVWHTRIDSIALLLFSVLEITEIRSKSVRFSSILIAILYVYLSFASDSNIFGWVTIILIIPLFFTREGFYKRVYHYFYKIFLYTMIVSFCVYVVVCLIGISLPYQSILPLNQLKLERYFAYPFLIMTSNGGVRFFGLFDEPGVIGTLGAMILMVEQFNFKKKTNIALLFITCFTFSMFFFVICALYVLVFAKTKYKLIVTGIVLLFIVYFWSNDVMYELVFKRFMLNDNGQLIGNTREYGDFEEWFNSFRGTSAYFTGLGAGKGAILNEGGSSYKQIIVDYGVIFFFLFCMFFLLASKRYFISKKCMIIYLMLFLLTLYQRPFITNIIYIYFFYSGALLIAETEKSLKR